MRVDIVILGIKQDTQHLRVFEEVYRFGHQARSNTPAPKCWMDRDPHEVAGCAVQRIKLVPYHLAIQLRHYKIRVRAGNIGEGNGVVAPQVLEAFSLDNQQRGYIAWLERADRNLPVALAWNVVVKFVVGVQQAIWRKAMGEQDIAQPVLLYITAGVV